MDCLHQRIEQLDDFFARFKRENNIQRMPFGGGFDLTYRCNLNCHHCYRDPAGKELTFEQYRTIFDEMVKLGCYTVFFTGGEALLREDFAELFIYLRKKGVLVSILSNATLVDDKIIKLFKKYPPYLFDATIYGSTKEVYESITKVPGSFKACLEGLNRLKKIGVKIELKTIIMKENSQQFEEMAEISKKYCDRFRFDGQLTPSFDKKRDPLQHRLTAKEIIEIEDKYPKTAEFWQDHFAKCYGRKRGDKQITCGAAKNGFHLSAEGKMYPCITLHQPAIDVLKNGFAQAFNEIGKIHNHKLTKKNSCSECEIGFACGQCAAWSSQVHNDLETKVDFVCQMNKIRFKKYGGTLKNEQKRK